MSTKPLGVKTRDPFTSGGEGEAGAPATCGGGAVVVGVDAWVGSRGGFGRLARSRGLRLKVSFQAKLWTPLCMFSTSHDAGLPSLLAAARGGTMGAGSIKPAPPLRVASLRVMCWTIWCAGSGMGPRGGAIGMVDLGGGTGGGTGGCGGGGGRKRQSISSLSNAALPPLSNATPLTPCMTIMATRRFNGSLDMSSAIRGLATCSCLRFARRCWPLPCGGCGLPPSLSLCVGPGCSCGGEGDERGVEVSWLSVSVWDSSMTLPSWLAITKRGRSVGPSARC
mmetsp:Transcript_18438/g.52680  ORF Transcript_18438/g.52680 Transcript_18438/m.52680 type:complete len:280 (-) Transcript_18438:179-1018(-)